MDTSKEGIAELMDDFRERVQQWDKTVFENLFDRKFRCLARLGGIQKALGRKQSEYLQYLEQKLRDELQEILAQEECFWCQKSRME